MKYYLKNGYFKCEEGFTLIEVLVSTIILIILFTVFALSISSMLGNSRLLKEGRAFYAAKQEIDFVLAGKLTGDTAYTVNKPFFLIKRTTKREDKMYFTSVIVFNDTAGTKLVELNAAFTK